VSAVLTTLKSFPARPLGIPPATNGLGSPSYPQPLLAAGARVHRPSGLYCFRLANKYLHPLFRTIYHNNHPLPNSPINTLKGYPLARMWLHVRWWGYSFLGVMRQASPSRALLREIKTFCREVGISHTYFGKLACNNSELVERLEAGGTVTLATAEKVRAFIAAERAAA
jgi:hypothetical protein